MTDNYVSLHLLNIRCKSHLYQMIEHCYNVSHPTGGIFNLINQYTVIIPVGEILFPQDIKNCVI